MKSEKFRKFSFKSLASNALQCATCEANFEVWVGNQRISEGREENLRKHFLSYCPECGRVDEKNL